MRESKGATEFGSYDLEATIVTDFPSWYWPGHTTLVLYRPRKAVMPFPAPAPAPTDEMIREGEDDVVEAEAHA